MIDPQTERFLVQVPSLLAELERRSQALFHLTLTPTPAALPALEEIADFLWQTRDTYQEHDRRINIMLLGTYVGEIVRRAAGGAWQIDPALGLPLVNLPGGQRVSPMTLVQARLDQGGPPLTAIAAV